LNLASIITPLYPPTSAKALPILSLTLPAKFFTQLGSIGCNVAHIARVCPGFASAIRGRNGAYWVDRRCEARRDDAVLVSRRGNRGCGSGAWVNSGRRERRGFGAGIADARVEPIGRPRFSAEGRYRLLLCISN
jgi:hypothetical protein